MVASQEVVQEAEGLQKTVGKGVEPSAETQQSKLHLALASKGTWGQASRGLNPLFSGL